MVLLAVAVAVTKEAVVVEADCNVGWNRQEKTADETVVMGAASCIL